MESTVRIRAEVLANQISCKFTLDRPLFKGGFARIVSKDKTQGSPLAVRLFEIPGVTNIDIGEDFVIVTKNSTDDWRSLGPKMGQAIRDHVASGQPAVTEEMQAELPEADKLRAKVQKILDEQINPAVASHGGFISLIDVQGKDLFIQMGGGCQGCGQANVTLREGIEQAIREQVPEVGLSIDSSDHEAGENPYFARH